MAAKRFPSKIDTWLVVLFAAVILGQIVAVAVAIAETPKLPAVLIGVGSLLITIPLIGSLLKATYYEVSSDSLRIVTGPFRWKIARDEITAIEPTHSPLSSPALSLDRLRVSYGRRRVLVSPADKRGFMKALGFTLQGTRISGATEDVAVKEDTV